MWVLLLHNQNHHRSCFEMVKEGNLNGIGSFGMRDFWFFEFGVVFQIRCDKGRGVKQTFLFTIGSVIYNKIK